MISYGQAVVLGIIQGLSEFIPISSTAHLRIVPALLGWDDPGAAYSAVIQLGTLAALLIYFWRDILYNMIVPFVGPVFVKILHTSFARSFLEKRLVKPRSTLSGLGSLAKKYSEQPYDGPDARLVWYLVLATIPVSVFGLTFKRFITEDARSLYVIASSLIGLGIILWLVDHFSKRDRELSSAGWKEFLMVGLAQSMALIPGSSRSGTTLTMGLLLGFTREAAMRISFLLGIPAIGASGVYELYKEWNHLEGLGLGGLLVGTIVSGIVGFAAIAGTLRFLKSHSTLVFVLYRIGMGLFILMLLYQGLVKPQPPKETEQQKSSQCNISNQKNAFHPCSVKPGPGDRVIARYSL